MRKEALNQISRIRNRLAFKAAPLGVLLCALLISPATPLAPVAEAKPARDMVFAGQVAPGGPVVFRVSRNGRLMKFATASLYLECSDGSGFSFDDEWSHVRIYANGRMSASYSDSFTDEEYAVEMASSLRARMNRRKLKITGTWQLTVNLRDLATGEITTCDSGPARFTARR